MFLIQCMISIFALSVSFCAATAMDIIRLQEAKNVNKKVVFDTNTCIEGNKKIISFQDCGGFFVSKGNCLTIKNAIL